MPPPTSPTPCPALTWNKGRPCGRPSTKGSRYCPTHHFLLEADQPAAGYSTAFDPSEHDAFRQAKTLGLDQEIALIRVHIMDLLEVEAPHRELLDSLRTLALMARLHATIERLYKPRRR